MKRKITDINANQIIRSGDPAWYFLGELLLSEILAYPRSYELTDGLWVQTVCELRMPLDCVENIKRTLAGFARSAWVQAKQGKLDTPGRIYLFCHQKILNDVNSAQPPNYTETAGEHIKMGHLSTVKMNGAWGYFVIEKGGKLLTGSSMPCWNSIDLYLYKEGE